ncbi:hypothetical protein SDC9_142845 [bioreactor metagenome]|uniref:Uncharacterized protein n=1 Tax=bioreactor metagenome TaxID=1076179 RepID=A0A645E1R0_9ZZZZ
MSNIYPITEGGSTKGRLNIVSIQSLIKVLFFQRSFKAIKLSIRTIVVDIMEIFKDKIIALPIVSLKPFV